jgi:hypothetical protein
VRLFHGPHQNKFDAEVVKALQPLGAQVEYVQCDRKGRNALDFRIVFALGRIVQEREHAASQFRRQATFAVVSKDGGFDELLDHLRTLGYGATRVPSIALALDFARDGGTRSSPVETSPSAASTGAIADALGKPPAARPTPSAALVAKPATNPASTPKATKASPKQAVAAAQGKAANDPLARVIANLREHPRNRPRTEAALHRYLKTLLGKGATDAQANALKARLDREGVTKAVDGKIEYRLPAKNAKAAA